MPASAQEPIRFLGETLGLWIQTGAFVISAGYAALQVKMLRKQTKTTDRQARRRATVDMVIHEKQDANLREARRTYAKLRDGGTNLTQFACKPMSDHPEEHEALLAVLNHYEFIAAGIKQGAFDEGMYRRMKRSLVIHDWDSLSGYAIEMRKQTRRDKLFVETEWLAAKWKAEGQRN